MAIKADWFVDLDVEEDGDPFAVEDEGLPIEVGDEEARVSSALSRSIEKEGRLYNQGVTCAIKDRPDTTCWACPVYQGHDRSSSLGVLCRTGREQERLATRIGVLQVEEQEREEAVEEAKDRQEAEEQVAAA